MVIVLGLATWALWPRGASPSGTDAHTHTDSQPRKYTIRVAPGIYLPGTRPQDLGSPLKGLADVTRAFEKLYPDTRIEFTAAPVGQREYLITQLAAGQAPDIINVNVGDVWQDVQKGWYLPLDKYLEEPNPFIPKGQPGSKQWWDQFKYQAISRSKTAPDGKVYCVTYDMVETGIFYNKSIFAKLGLHVPRDWSEFLQIQLKLKEAGITPFLADSGSIADWGVDLIFNQLYGSIIPGIKIKRDPSREAHLSRFFDWDELAYLNTKGFFTRRDPRFIETFRLLKGWRQFFEKDMSTSNLTKEFVTQRGAMYWTGSWEVNRLTRDPDVGFDWGLFYLPPIPQSFDRFADGHDQCVIGGSGTQFEVTNSAFVDTGNPETSEKLKRAIAFIQFLTVPKNVDHVVNEISCFLPNVVGADPKPELKPFDTILQREFANTKWLFTFDLRFDEIMRRMLDLYINGGISEDEFMSWMETNVKTACDTIVRRKRIDLSKFDAKWKELAPLRVGMKELPSER